MAEYEELLGQGDNSSTSSLSTIEERANWEKQLNDLEEETEAQVKQIAQLESQLEQLRRARAEDAARSQEEKDQLTEDLQSTKLMLAEAIEREAKLITKLENMRDPPVKTLTQQNRPMSPTPKPGILPPGYSPLKSKGWAKSQRSPASLSPCKSFESTIDGVDGRTAQVRFNTRFEFKLRNEKKDIKNWLLIQPPNLTVDLFLMFQLTRSPSLNSGTSNEPHRVGRVDISVFQALNTRLKQQEQRCRELYYALQHQKHRTEQIMFGNEVFFCLWTGFSVVIFPPV